MRVVGYLRVSTDRQAERGHGLDVQRQAIQKWAKANKHRVVLWCVDEGVSGSNGLDTRDALPDALHALRAGDATAVVVYRLDRLARDLVLQETLLADVRRMGADVFSTSPSEAAYLGDDPDDPSRKLIRQVLGAVNEYERAMVRLRLRGGRRRKAELGGFAFGSPPFGQRAVDHELVADDDEQRTLARIEELHQSGASLRAMADVLTAEGYRPKRSDRWHPQSLSRIVARLDAG